MGRARLGERGGRWRATALLCAVLPACASASGTSGPRTPTVAAVADSIRHAPPLDRAHWGIAVLDAESGRSLYAFDAEKHFVPASTVKLVVAATALETLGPEYRYRTEILAIPADGDTAVSALVVVGSGDPTLSRRFHPEGPHPIEMLADSITAAGVRRIVGDVVVDGSRFDSVGVHPTWEVGDLPWAYAAPAAAFAIDEAAVGVVVAPGATPGAPARVELLAPLGHLVVVTDVVTEAAGARRVLRPHPTAVGDTVRLHGVVPLDAPMDTILLAASNPAVTAARALVAALVARGVTIDGAVRVVYDPATAASLRSGARPVARWTSPPLATIVPGLLQPSQNWIAEQLLWTLGAERGERGGWHSGLAAERAFLFGVVGIDSAAVVLHDASGLSAQNLLTPATLARILTFARTRPWGDSFRAALARPGLEGSTLEDRLAGYETRVSAKTGTLTNVNALAGYVDAVDGRVLAFTVLINATGRPASDTRRAIDRIVATIVEDAGRR